MLFYYCVATACLLSDLLCACNSIITPILSYCCLISRNVLKVCHNSFFRNFSPKNQKHFWTSRHKNSQPGSMRTSKIHRRIFNIASARQKLLHKYFLVDHRFSCTVYWRTSTKMHQIWFLSIMLVGVRCR